MKILLVAATSAEIAPLIDQHGIGPRTDSFTHGKHHVKVLITGVGMVSTAFALGQELAQNSYDLAINAGIAGSFDRSIPLGKVLHISDDTFAELGAEDAGGFIPIDTLGFGTQYTHALSPAIPLPFLETIQKASAITVNKVHGDANSIAATISKYPVHVESMEGAAFLYCCLQYKLPCAQIRAISNRVEVRNKADWNMKEAILNLNLFVKELLLN